MKINTFFLLGLCLSINCVVRAQKSYPPGSIATIGRPDLDGSKLQGALSKSDLKKKGFSYKAYKKAEDDLVETLGELQKREAELFDLINASHKKLFVSGSNYDNVVISKFQSLSGTEVKNGKFMGSSASVDAKSITVNLALRPDKESEVYLLPTVTATAKEGVVDLFKDNKYSRTITGGMNFVALTSKNSSNFSARSRNALHVDIDGKIEAFLRKGRNDRITFLKTTLTELNSIFTDSNKISLIKEQLLGTFQTDGGVALAKVVSVYKKAADTLSKLGVLPKHFPEMTLDDQQLILSKLDIQPRLFDVVAAEFLDQIDKMQQKAKFLSHSIFWVAGGLKYNQGNFFVAEPMKLVKSVQDEYVSTSFSLTWMRLTESGHRFYLSPTLNFKNKHNYKTSDLIKAQVVKNYTIGSNVVEQISKELSFYPSVPNRLNNFYLDIPFAYYNVKRNVGLELGIKAGVNDVENDNLSVRLGILIPISSGEKNQLIIEPLFSFQKLNQGVNKLLTEKFVFGVNLSVTIPKTLFGKDL